MTKKVIKLQDAVDQFVARILQRDPRAQIGSSTEMVFGSGMEPVITIVGSDNRVSRYSVWQNDDGTVGGSTWVSPGN